MKTWEPILPKPLQLEESQANFQFNKRRFALIAVGISGLIATFIIPKSSLFFIPAVSFLFLLFLLLYFRWRKFFFSYLYTYEGKRWKFYYEDYSWKDSSILSLLILIGGIVVVFSLIAIFIKVNPPFW